MQSTTATNAMLKSILATPPPPPPRWDAQKQEWVTSDSIVAAGTATTNPKAHPNPNPSVDASTLKPKPTLPWVVGIDLGTSRSGFAFAHVLDPQQKVICERLGQQGAKIPTCLLLKNTPSFELLAFGELALSMYETFVADNTESEVLFVSNFKMELYRLTVNTDPATHTIAAMNNPKAKIPLVVVVARALEWLKSEALKRIGNTTKQTLVASQVRWILTYPAIWSTSAKEFMRVAATRAGIPNDNLSMTLESEAAAICCRKAHLKRVETNETKTNASSPTQSNASLVPSNASNPTQPTKTELKDPQKGFAQGLPSADDQKKVIFIADLGGGTGDFTVHRIVDDVRDVVVEVCPSSGGIWGSTVIDHYFVEFLKKLFGQKLIRELQDEHAAEYMDLLKTFESVKFLVDPKRNQTHYNVRLPSFLIDAIKEMKLKREPKGMQVPFCMREESVDLKHVLMDLERQHVNPVPVGPGNSNVSTKETSPTETKETKETKETGVVVVALGTGTNTVVEATTLATSLNEGPLTSVSATSTGAKTSMVIVTGPGTSAPVASDVWYINTVLRIPTSYMLQFHKRTVDEIVNYMKLNCDKYKLLLKHVFMVGGFSQSLVLQHHLELMMSKHFPELGPFVIPPFPSEAVLTGSVLYGLRPEQIEARVSPLSYGLLAAVHWNPNVHGRLAKAVKINTFGQPYCSNGVHVFCKKNQVITRNQSFSVRVLATASDREMVLNIGSTSNPDPVLMSDGLVPVCQVKIKLDTKVQVQKQPIEVSFFLGETELRLEARNTVTDEHVSAQANALSTSAATAVDLSRPLAQL